MFARPYGAANPAFAALRKQFEVDGWFERDPVQEASVLGQVVGLYGLGQYLVGRCRLNPVKPKLKPRGTKRLKLN
jgi:hypothetical protein